MPIQRTKPGDYKRVKTLRLQQRHADDFDLAWQNHRVYVIDKGEWFDPHTSSHSENGVSRHAMHGPSLITVTDMPGCGLQTYETYVNDPVQWAWIRRSIKEGYLTADTIQGDCNEQNVTIN